MKLQKSFSLLEVMLVITLLSLFYAVATSKYNNNNLKLATDRLVLYLNYTRFLAINDNKYNAEDELWFRKRWTFKIQNCSKTVGGIYYLIYSDENKKGHANKNETLKDPLTQKWIYSDSNCENSSDESEFVLLTKEFQIENAELSCNSTTTIAHLSFGNDGKVYTKLSNLSQNEYKYMLMSDCYLKLIDKYKNYKTIRISSSSGLVDIYEE